MSVFQCWFREAGWIIDCSGISNSWLISSKTKDISWKENLEFWLQENHGRIYITTALTVKVFLTQNAPVYDASFFPQRLNKIGSSYPYSLSLNLFSGTKGTLIFNSSYKYGT
jgi:hypothetical protein